MKLLFLMHWQKKAFVYLDSFSLADFIIFLRLITTSASEGEGEKIDTCPLCSHVSAFSDHKQNELH